VAGDTIRFQDRPDGALEESVSISGWSRILLSVEWQDYYETQCPYPERVAWLTHH
jgi:hypothetical protein